MDVLNELDVIALKGEIDFTMMEDERIQTTTLNFIRKLQKDFLNDISCWNCFNNYKPSNFELFTYRSRVSKGVTLEFKNGLSLFILLDSDESGENNFHFAHRYQNLTHSEVDEFHDFVTELIYYIIELEIIRQKLIQLRNGIRNRWSAMDVEISNLRKKVPVLKSKISRLNLERLMNGERFYFDEPDGKKIYTHSRRPEYYRWIEITDVNKSGTRVTVRGLVREEFKQWEEHESTYKTKGKVIRMDLSGKITSKIKRKTEHFDHVTEPTWTLTENDMEFERKNVYVKLLIRSL